MVLDGGAGRGAVPAPVPVPVPDPVPVPVPDPRPLLLTPDPPLLRLILALASLAAWLALVSLARAPLALAWLASSPLLLASLAAPAWARASMRRFDRDALSLVATARSEALRDRLRRAMGMRLFGAPEELAARRGMVAAACGDPIAARAAYARALGAYADEDRAPVAVRLGHAHACYEAGDDDEAAWRYARLLETAGPLPRVRLQLAHVRVRCGAIDPRTSALLDAAERDRDAPAAEIALVRAIADAARGRRAMARMRARDVAPATPRERALASELAPLLERPRRSA